jgi:hypothetical protein
MVMDKDKRTVVERHPKIAELLHDIYDPNRFFHYQEKNWKIHNIRFKKGVLVVLLIRDWFEKGEMETLMLIGDEIPEDMALHCRKILLGDYEHIQKQILKLQSYIKSNDLMSCESSEGDEYL